MSDVLPLRLAYTKSAGENLKSAILFLDDISSESADRFEAALYNLLEVTCERVAREIIENGRPIDAPHNEASTFFSRPIYRLRLDTAKKRARRSSSGLWYVFYSLRDADSDSTMDTLLVRLIQHSAARPLSVKGVEGSDEAE